MSKGNRKIRTTKSKSSTEPIEVRASRALYQTWSAIGCDTMLAYADGNYAKAERMTLNKDEVVDCVLSCGIKGGYPSSFGEDDEAVEWLDSQPEEVQQRVIDDAFPFTRYGL